MTVRHGWLALLPLSWLLMVSSPINAGGPTVDGGGAFVATLLRAAHNNNFVFGGTVSPYVWVTQRSYQECDFGAAIDVSPGTGNQWTFSAEYATLAPDQNCADVTAWTTAPLCAIKGSSKNCSASDVPINVVGPACLRGRAVIAPGDNVGAPTKGSAGVASLHCRDAGMDGSTHFQGTGGTTVTGNAFFGGDVIRSPNQDRAHWLHAGDPLRACGGMIAVPAAPGAGNTWHMQVAASRTALAAGQSCADLTYATTSDACTISGNNKECHFSPVAVSVPTGGCLQLRGTCTGGSCQAGAGFSPNYGLDCSAESQPPYAAGGPTYQSAGSGAFDAGHTFDVGPWGISDANQAAVKFSQQYWLAPPSGLASCGGALTFENPLAGTGEYDIGLTVSTAAPTSGQSCLGVTYVPTAARCSVKAGQKSCWFPPTATPIPGGACFALFASTSQGTPSASGSQFNWQVTCAAPAVSPPPPPSPPPTTPPALAPPILTGTLPLPTGVTSSDPNHLAGTDLNGDGLEDLLVTQSIWQSTTQFELVIFVNDGQGGLREATRTVFSGAVPRTMDPRRLLIAELNGDQRPDIFVGDQGQDVWNPLPPGFHNTLALSAPNGSMIDATSTNLPALNGSTHAASAADVDGDFDTDLFVGDYRSRPYLLMNQGVGSFQVGPSALPTALDSAANPSASAFVDANGDGATDLVLAGADYFTNGNRYPSNSYVLLNDGKGHFGIVPGSLPAKPFAYTGDALDVRPIELNGDGLQDLLIAWTSAIPYYEGRLIQVLMSNGDGTFRDETSSRLPQSNNRDTPIFFLDAIDLNHDGALDIATHTAGPPTANSEPYFLNDGTGHFVALPGGLGLGTSPYAFIDVDGDGGKDVVSIDSQRNLLLHRDRGAPRKTLYGRVLSTREATLRTEFGQTGSAIPAGSYQLVVTDESTKSGFCMKGPGMKYCTPKADTGRFVVPVTLQALGKYKVKRGDKFQISN